MYFLKEEIFVSDSLKGREEEKWGELQKNLIWTRFTTLFLSAAKQEGEWMLSTEGGDEECNLSRP